MTLTGTWTKDPAGFLVLNWTAGEAPVRYQAPSAGAVRAAVTRAGLRPERITQAVTVRSSQARSGRRNRCRDSRPELGARPHRDVPAARAQPGRGPLPGPAAENGVMTGRVRPCCLPPSPPPGS
jgi:hypothetical protein